MTNHHHNTPSYIARRESDAAELDALARFAGAMMRLFCSLWRSPLPPCSECGEYPPFVGSLCEHCWASR